MLRACSVAVIFALLASGCAGTYHADQPVTWEADAWGTHASQDGEDLSLSTLMRDSREDPVIGEEARSSYNSWRVGLALVMGGALTSLFTTEVLLFSSFNSSSQPTSISAPALGCLDLGGLLLAIVGMRLVGQAEKRIEQAVRLHDQGLKPAEPKPAEVSAVEPFFATGGGAGGLSAPGFEAGVRLRL